MDARDGMQPNADGAGAAGDAGGSVGGAGSGGSGGSAGAGGDSGAAGAGTGSMDAADGARLDARPDIGRSDGPSPTAKRVFVSSTAPANGNLGGNAGGDQYCQSLANALGLGGGWKAWLSETSLITPDTSFTHASVPYRLVDGTTIANNWTELTSGTLQHAIDLDETGAQALVEVWTGTVRNGRAEGDACSGWSTSSFSVNAEVGLSNMTDYRWTSAYLQPCDVASPHLYCFEQ